MYYIEKLGKTIGFFSAILIFSAVIYFVWGALGKLHDGIEYWHIVIFSAAIYILGLAIKRFFYE